MIGDSHVPRRIKAHLIMIIEILSAGKSAELAPNVIISRWKLTRGQPQRRTSIPVARPPRSLGRKERGRLLIRIGHVRVSPGSADNERITRSGAERKGWLRGVGTVRGWERAGAQAAPRKSSVNALFRRGGFTVGTVYA